MPETETYTDIGDYKLGVMQLVNSAGGVVPLNDYFVQFSLSEDLFRNFLTTTMVITDVNNLPGVFPIIGNEQLLISFKTPKFADREITLNMACVNYREKEVGENSKTQGYELTFVSNSYLDGINKKISKAFEGRVSDIVDQVIQENIDDPRSVEISQTDGKFKFVMPFTSPYETINFLKRKAFASRKEFTDSSFMFYETSDGLNFKSLHEIKNQQPITELNYYPKNTSMAGVDERRFNSGELMEFPRTFNRILEMNGSMYSGAITKYDLTSKQIESKIVSLEDLDVKSNRLNAETLSPEEIKYFRKGILSHSVVNHQAFTQNDIQDNRKLFDLFLNRNIDILRSKSLTVTLVVPGNSDLSVGQVVYFDVPKIQVESETESASDPVASGKYILSKVEHVLLKNDYTCYIELIKDSVIESLISAT